ncbi:DUF962 domain-containing protein [Oscillatoria sp. HE19RPO]|uniref:DUF962 domain-containing protein n=1 Tax=Oscillatoria sp. HE19RPO TaxID=2954806 RepID=UPI0020C4D31C|nr:DUF962 domain-containing protein [Oscillatoria sp. HE19RPO]
MNGSRGQQVREDTEYWDIFLLKHQHPMNVALHVVGILIFYGLLFSALWFQNPWILLGLPLTQLTGLMGHFLFERSEIELRDAVFSWRASFCLGRMLWRILLGKYKEDVRQRVELLGVERGILEGGKITTEVVTTNVGNRTTEVVTTNVGKITTEVVTTNVGKILRVLGLI